MMQQLLGVLFSKDGKEPRAFNPCRLPIPFRKLRAFWLGPFRRRHPPPWWNMGHSAQKNARWKKNLDRKWDMRYDIRVAAWAVIAGHFCWKHGERAALSLFSLSYCSNLRFYIIGVSLVGLGALVCRCPRPFCLALFCWPLVATYDAVHDDACNQQTCGKLMQIEKQLGHHSMPLIYAIYIYILYIYISYIHAYDLGGCKHWCGPAFGENECRSFHNAYGATPAWFNDVSVSFGIKGQGPSRPSN